ncbi:MAG: aspartate kinase [Muribaculaceae bacterium]|nr:aspartate kinase [Muribaculaceae bacterium]
MKVLKFGGTSVGSAQRIINVAGLISGRGRNVVVLSAMSGTTNTLVEIADYLMRGNNDGAKETLNNLEKKYAREINGLFPDDSSFKQAAWEGVSACISIIRSFTNTSFTTAEKTILAQGERMSTVMMYQYLLSQGINVVLLDALEFMRIDRDNSPEIQYLHDRITPMIERNPDAQIFLTQGYICRNAKGAIDNLQRGGSDLTASLIGAAIEADEIEIWTDIDGMHNNDPRFVSNTRPVNHLNFEEAAELAYFGAKILHPSCVLPAKLNNIPVRLLNTMQPDAPGTLIDNRLDLNTKGIKAIAAKDDIVAIRIKSGRMLLAYGFLQRVFQVFASHKTPIDMVATSEVGVSVTLESRHNITEIVNELKKFSTVTVDNDMVIICVVGDLEWHNSGLEAKAIDAMRDIPVRMISYGGSDYNISFLVSKDDKVKALNALSDHLFN